jgi:hypothetical protein
MAQPTRFSPSFNFTDWQIAHPSDPLPGDEVDIQFANLQTTTDGICNNLALIQRDDGLLANGVVAPESLSASVRNLMGNYVPRGAWVTATAYAVRDVVSTSDGTYVCAIAHTAGTFATDYTAGKWLLLATTGAASATSFTPTGSSAPVNGMYLPASSTVGFAADSLDVLRLATVASAQNYFLMTNSSGANAVVLSAVGVAANIDITLTPKGTGLVNAPGLNVTGSSIPANGVYLPAGNTLGLTSRSLDVVRLSNPASAVNYWSMVGAATGGALSLYATGSDTNVAMTLSTKGSGAFSFATSGGSNTQFQIAHVASAVNYLLASGAAAAAAPSLLAAGTDTNIGVSVSAKGSGAITFYTNGGSQTQVQIQHVASAVNYWGIKGAAAGGDVYLQALGSDANIGIRYETRGTGGHKFYTEGGASLGMVIACAASAVNYIQLANAATGGQPSLAAAGTDTNISMNLTAKGTGGFNFITNNSVSAATQLQILHTASAVNYWTFTGSPTGQIIQMQAAGSDADVSLQFKSKGAGAIYLQTNGADRFSINGSFPYVGTAALATTATTGMLWLTSSAGPPTGAAVAPYTNAAAFHYDSTNNRIYVRCGGTWRSTAALT